MNRDHSGLKALSGEDGVLSSPRVGWWRPSRGAGELVRPGDVIGTLEVLGHIYSVYAPDVRPGIIQKVEKSLRLPTPVQYGTPLVRLEASAGLPEDTSEESHDASAALVFCAPMSGRFYSRPGPDQPAFVRVGDEVTTGQTVGLLEVMKTFNRLVYGGAALPEKARVKAVVPADEADVEQGDPILELDPRA